MVCLSTDFHLARLPAATFGVRRACLRRPGRVRATTDESPQETPEEAPKLAPKPAPKAAEAASEAPPKPASEAPPKPAPMSASKERLSPLQKGGTLSGEKALGKDAGASTKRGDVGEMTIVDGVFVDERWVDGRWDTKQFLDASGEVDWDAVIDAEMGRRALLEDSPTPSINDAVNFDTSDIPWWAWVRRFHLPVAETLNGRAAMVGYFAALVVEQFSGSGLLEQQNSFFGKVLLHITIFAILLIREVGDIDRYRNLIDEAFFYDRQWNAAWEGKVRPSETEE